MKTSFWTRLFDLISPRSCPVCGKRLSVNECVLCASCHLHLPLTGFEQSPLDNPMARLFWGQFPVERAAALGISEAAITAIMTAIHDESVRVQNQVLEG